MTIDRPFRRGLRRPPPGLHRPLVPAPETPDEVLERSPDDVSRETSSGGDLEKIRRVTEASEEEITALQELAASMDTPPPLRKDQVARLEALTAQWSRRVRLAGSPDDTMLLSAAPKPPPPPSTRRASVLAAAPATIEEEAAHMLEDLDEVTILTPELAAAVLEPPPPVPDEDLVLERSRQLLEDNQPPDPAPARVPGVPGPARPARVSDWQSRHDRRSLEYPVRARLARAVPLADVSIDTGPALDQGTTPPLTVWQASACVGMATAAAVNALRLRRAARQLLAVGQGRSVELLTEDDALRLYTRAQELDHVHGQDYNGTSVLAGMRAAQEAGLIDGYLWALGGTKDVAQVLLQLRVAVVVGVPWSSDLEDPDPFGVIRPGGVDSGGHALAVVGLKLGMIGARPGPWFELQQSRGPAEGVGGRVYLHHTQLARLLAGIGEAAVPLTAEDLQ